MNKDNSTVVNSLSNGHFIGYYNTAGTTLTFKINADIVSTDNTLKLCLGLEYGTLKVEPFAFEIAVNGTALNYKEISVTVSAINNPNTDIGYKTAFKDYSLDTKFDLKAGENVITLKLLDNSLGEKLNTAALLCIGPGVDCIKIKSTSTLTWNSKWEDNKENISIEG